MVIWHLTSLTNFSAISLFLPSITHNLTMLSTVTGASDNFLIFWTALLYYSRTMIVLVVVPRVSTAPRALTDAQPKMCGRSQAFPPKMIIIIIAVVIIINLWISRDFHKHRHVPSEHPDLSETAVLAVAQLLAGWVSLKALQKLFKKHVNRDNPRFRDKRA